ncbi:MAG: hypothetical protein AAGD09_11465 [Cyanobacteria bacterium P01_F01_bin.56]
MKTREVIASTPTVTSDGVVLPPEYLVSGVVALGLAGVAWLIKRELANSDRRLKSLEAAHAENEAQIEVLERENANLRAQLPNDYVRRDDWIRFSTTLEQKLDALHRRFDAALHNWRSPQ